MHVVKMGLQRHDQPSPNVLPLLQQEVQDLQNEKLQKRVSSLNPDDSV